MRRFHIHLPLCAVCWLWSCLYYWGKIESNEMLKKKYDSPYFLDFHHSFPPSYLAVPARYNAVLQSSALVHSGSLQWQRSVKKPWSFHSPWLGPVSTLLSRLLLGKTCRHSLLCFCSRLIWVDLSSLRLHGSQRPHNKCRCITSDSDSRLKSACWSDDDALSLLNTYLSNSRQPYFFPFFSSPPAPHHSLLFGDYLTVLQEQGFGFQKDILQS